MEIKLYRVFTVNQRGMLARSRDFWDMDRHYSKVGVWLFNDPLHLRWAEVNEALATEQENEAPLFEFVLKMHSETLGKYEDYSLKDLPRRFLIPSDILNNKTICHWRSLSEEERLEMGPACYTDYPRGEPIKAIRELLRDYFRFIVEDD